MRVWIIVSFVSVLSGAVAAGPHPLSGVGRLESSENRACSAVLIAPDLVLTAAHCVETPESKYAFHSAAYPGTPGRSRQVLAIAPHPLFQLGLGRGRGSLRVDIALIRLAAPFEPQFVRPIQIGSPPVEGETYHVTSYLAGRGNRPRERKCAAYDRTAGVFSLGCVVNGGESGAPVLRLTEDGPEVAAILTARSQEKEQPIGLAVPVAPHTRTLTDALSTVEIAADGDT